MKTRGEQKLLSFFLLQHYLKRDSLFKSVELNEAISTKLNGYLAGYGTREQFDEQKDSFGLDGKQEEHVRAHINK